MTAAPPPRTTEAPWKFAAPWQARGYITRFDGPVHWIEFTTANQDQDQDLEENQERSTEPPVVFVHGLGGSHLNWCLIGPQLAVHRRVYALDLHGFGLTPGTRGNSTVQANQRLLDQFVCEVTGTPVILAGNSMGGLISLLQTAAAPDTVQGLVLLDPVLPLPPTKPDWAMAGQFLLQAVPGVGEFYLSKTQTRQSPQVAMQRVIELCFADPARADPAMITASIALASQRQGEPGQERTFLAALRSMLWVTGHQRQYWEMTAGVRVPVLLFGGDADRLVPVAAVRQAGARNPQWDTVVLAGVGHTPQLEVPGAVVATMQDWLDRHFTRATR